jgi:hypothetical protein
MADADAGDGGAAAAAPAGGGESWLQAALRYVSYYVMVQFALSLVFPKQRAGGQEQLGRASSGDASVLPLDVAALPEAERNAYREQQRLAAPPTTVRPHWREGTAGRLTVYLVENRSDHDALRDAAVRASAIRLHRFDVRHAEAEPEQSHNVTLNLTSCAQRNCSLFVHVMFVAPALESATACIPFTRFELVRRSKLRNLFAASGNESSDPLGPDAEAAAAAAASSSTTPPSAAVVQQDEAATEVVAAAEVPSSSSSSAAAETSERGAADVAVVAPRRADANDTFIVATIPPSITVNVVADWQRWELSAIPPPMAPFVRRLAHDPLHADQYPPSLFINEFWVLDEYRHVFNASSAASVNLTLTTAPMSLMKFLMYVSFIHQAESQAEWGLQSSKAFDDVKRMLLETEPWLLAVTLVVSLLHMLFEYLTFSSDVQFWRGRKNFRGLSLRTVAVNCYFQTIIFLFLLDGNETSYAVLLPSGIGVLIEYWKLAKTVVVERIVDDGRSVEDVASAAAGTAASAGASTAAAAPPANVAAAAPPVWQFWKRYRIRNVDSYDARTRDFDQQAMRYLFFIMAPCLVAYSIYSAVYDVHKGWYSFLIRTQVRFIYWSGFIMMTPQIFINYKLKTVGQLPWKAFIYKALNTFIDDLFAFVIKMPTMHRIAVFRDDLVFLILLYQRWIYPVDTTRSDGDDGAAADPAGPDAAVADATTRATATIEATSAAAAAAVGEAAAAAASAGSDPATATSAAS